MKGRIAVEGLAKRYGSRVALDGVTFTVDAGEIVGLLGPNGAGKTTTLGILATVLAADGGTATVAGHRLPESAREVRRSLGLVPQQTAVYPSLTARENLLFFGRMQGLDRAAAADATERALELVALENRADEPVAQFSSGMRRRLNLACGILHRPGVVLLDEPTVGVDPQSRERIFEAVESLARDGAAVLYSTHAMEEAERLCRRIVLLDAGRVVAEGSADRLIARSHQTPVVRLRLTRFPAPGWVDGVAGARLVGGAGAELTVSVPDTAAVPVLLDSLARAGGELSELEVRRPNLADVFFQLTGRALRDDDGGAGS